MVKYWPAGVGRQGYSEIWFSSSDLLFFCETGVDSIH